MSEDERLREVNSDVERGIRDVERGLETLRDGKRGVTDDSNAERRKTLQRACLTFINIQP